AWSPRVRRWSPYTSNRAERARMRSLCQFPVMTPGTVAALSRQGSRTSVARIGDNGHRIWRVGVWDPVRPEPDPRRRGRRMAAMRPRTGDGPLEVTKEGRGIVMRVPLEGGGRLVVELNAEEAGALGEALKEVVG